MIGAPARVLRVVDRTVRLNVRITRQSLHRLRRRVVADRKIRAALCVILSNRRTTRLDHPERRAIPRCHFFNLNVR